MDTVNHLLEGASPYQVMQDQAGKLANKWDRSGLLEGIESSTEKNNMSILLENQAKQLVNEANALGTAGTGQSVTNGANSEAWAGVALPLVRRVFGEIVAKDLVSVQPMNLPAGLIFYLDFQYGTERAGQASGESLYGATPDLKRTDGAFNKGLYGAGEYAYSVTESQITPTIAITEITTASFTDFFGDTEFSASKAGQFEEAGGHQAGVKKLTLAKTHFSGCSFVEETNVRAFRVASGSTGEVVTFPAFTRIEGDNIVFIYSGGVEQGGGADATQSGLTLTYFKDPVNLNDRGDFEENFPAAESQNVSGLDIPEINVQLRSETVSAKTRKLKAQWTPEFAQDLNAYHSIDAEAELTSILSEYISMEIDLEILDMLIKNADTVEAWSAKVAQDGSISGLTNANTTAGGTETPTVVTTTNASGVYYTKMSWFQTLGIKLQKVSNLIHQKTLRGGANFMVVSPKVSTILESIPGFAADSPGDSDKYAMGVQKIGAINNRYTVYKNPYMTENVILMGYKGSQFLETGAVFAPYIPLIMTPLVYDPVSFTPRKGIMTRYARKMVTSDFYGKVFIADLNEL
jgi:hypothetical protein